MMNLNKTVGTARGSVLDFLRLFWEASLLHFLNFSKALTDISSCFSIYLFFCFKLEIRFMYSISTAEGTVP